MPYRHSSKSINIEKSLERFAIGKKQDARPRHSSARPETNGKTMFFFAERQAVYDLERKAFQDERAFMMDKMFPEKSRLA